MKARGRLAIALGCVVAALIALGSFAYLNTRALDAAARAVRRGHGVVDRLAAVRAAAADAEAAARSLGSEPDPAAHATFAAARRELDRALASLRGSVADDAVRRRAVEALAPEVAQHAAWLDAVAQAAGGAEEGRAPAPPPQGSRLVEIRRTVHEMRTAEEASLAALHQRWSSRVDRADTVLAVGVVVGLAIFAPVFFRLYRGRIEAERAHEALRESEEHFRLLVESVRDYAIFLIDRSGTVVRWNRGAERVTGYAADEIVGRHVSRFYAPEDVAAGRPELDLEAAAIDGGCESDGDRVRKDGSRFFASMVLSPLFDDGHRVRGFSVAMRDESDRRRVEAALVASETRHRAVSELTSDYAYAFRVGGDGLVTVEWTAGAITRITGYSGEEIESMGGGIALVHPDDLPIALARVRNLVVRKPDTSEFRIVTKSGEVRWIREVARPAWDESGGCLRVFGAAQDITERRRAEEDAQRHQGALAHVLRIATINEMAAGLAHEINQPLAAIVSYARGCARRIRGGAADPNDLLHAVDEIALQAIRADEIIRRLQRFVRKDAPEHDAVQVNDLVHDALRLVNADAAERGVAVHLELASALPEARADGIQIEQVILNLVRNAFDAVAAQTSERRVLTITTSLASEGEIEVAVRDAGDGIRSDCLRDVFSPFFTTKPNGLGMGLAISRSIVEAHGGRIWASSEPGAGTTFRFTLPVPVA